MKLKKIDSHSNWIDFMSHLSFQKLMCCASDILEGKGVVQIAITVCELSKHQATPPNTMKSPQRYQNHNNNNNINISSSNGHNSDGFLSKSSSSSSSQLSSATTPTSPIV